MKLDIKSSLVRFVKSRRDREKNPTIWKILFIFEQFLIGGKNRKFVISEAKNRVSKFIFSFFPSPYRPKGIIYSVEHWFKEGIPQQMEGSWIKEVIPEYFMVLKKPNHIGNEIHPAFNWSQLNAKAQICFFKNASIVNENGIVISSDNKVFANFTYEFDKPIEQNQVFKCFINKPEFRKGCLATIAAPGYTGYYHWLVECLPRLKLLEEEIEKVDYLIVPYNLKKFHLDTLSLLGFQENRLIRMKDGIHLKCEKLFVPTIQGPRKWSADFLRQSFLPKYVVKPYRLLYISRKDALYRKAVNENEVEDYLKGIGFEIIQMSHMSFLDQVKICAEARIIVAPHGAGLTNTVFCQNAKILEIFSPNYINICFSLIANFVGNEYYYLLGADAPGYSPPAWRDYTIDMGSLKETVERLMKGT